MNGLVGLVIQVAPHSHRDRLAQVALRERQRAGNQLVVIFTRFGRSSARVFVTDLQRAAVQSAESDDEVEWCERPRFPFSDHWRIDVQVRRVYLHCVVVNNRSRTNQGRDSLTAFETQSELNGLVGLVIQVAPHSHRDRLAQVALRERQRAGNQLVVIFTRFGRSSARVFVTDLQRAAVQSAESDDEVEWCERPRFPFSDHWRIDAQVRQLSLQSVVVNNRSYTE